MFWYLVGLIATDGCLSGDGRHLTIAAKDADFLEAIRTAAGLSCRVTKVRGGFGFVGHRLQFSSRELWQRLQRVGLTPAKSLTLGPLSVPEQRFHDFFRGVIDGDGNIRRWQHPTNGREQWAVRIYGASEAFIRWLQATVERLWHVKGFVYQQKPKSERHHTLYTLKYGKLAARVILAKCYTSGSLVLQRKRVLAVACIAGSVGWAKSKTVQDRKSWKGWKYEHVWADRVANRTNPNVDPTSGLVKESGGLWAGVLEWKTVDA